MSDESDIVRIAEKWSQGDRSAFVSIHAAIVEFSKVRSASRLAAITPRQKDAFEFIKGFVAQNGFSPSMDEIRKGIGLGSKSGVSRLLRGLEARGCIKRHKEKARGISLT